MPRLIRLHYVSVNDFPILQGLGTTLVQGSIHLISWLPRNHRYCLEELTLKIFPEPLRHLCVVAKDLKKLTWARLLNDHVHPEDRVLYVVLVEDHRGVHTGLVLLFDQTESLGGYLLLEELVDNGVSWEILIEMPYLELGSRMGTAG